MSWIIRLQRLPLSAHAGDIRNFFAGLRIPEGSVHIVGGPDGDAFIGFATDEDARQAMRYDNRRIHDQRIRLLLSSRMEMEGVIARARCGAFNSYGVVANTSDATTVAATAPAAVSPASRRDDSTSSSSPAATATACLGSIPITTAADNFTNQRVAAAAAPATASAQQQHSAQVISDVYGTRSGTVHGQSDYPRATTEDAWSRAAEGSISDSWKNTSQTNYDSRASSSSSSSRQTSGTSAAAVQQTVGPWQDPQMLNVLGQSTHAASVYQQSNRDDRYSQYDPDNNFQGYNATLQPTASATTASTALTQAPSVYQQANVAASAVLPGQALQLPPGLIMPPMVASTLSNSVATAGIVTQTAANHPFVSQYSGRSGPIFPPALPTQEATIPNGHYNASEEKEEYYVEISRLPPELYRPAALEESFIRPSQPFTLSSVKVVFGDPEDEVPMHTLVRFENARDAQNTLDRDGELGIRIRPTTKEIFDQSVDDSFRISRILTRNIKENHHERSPRGGALLSRHHRSPPERRDFDGRRDERLRNLRDYEDRTRGPRRVRSRSPRDYRDYRETRRRDNGRHCVELTNLPFRVSEAEIRVYLGPRCEPMKVTRAYNEDGQASDRWIAEFSTHDLADRASRMRGKISERSIRARRITNAEADKMLAVPDKFGRQKKEEYERRHGVGESSITPLLDLPSRPSESSLHFQGSSRGRGGRGRGGLYRGGLFHGHPGERDAGDASYVNGYNGGASTSAIPPPRLPTYRPRAGLLPASRPRPPLISPPSFFGNTTPSTIRQRGPPPSGHGPPLLRGPRPPTVHPPNNGPAGPIPAIPPPSVKSCLMIENIPDDKTDDEIAELLKLNQTAQATLRRASNGIVYVDMGSMDEASKIVRGSDGMKIGEESITVTAITRQQMHIGIEKKAEPVEVLEPELIASVGEPGTVISCHGFPANVTLTDVAQFFDKYSLVESSVRIKLDDNGVPTGECLLAVGSPQEANKAVMLLSGRKLAGSTITMSVVRPANK